MARVNIDDEEEELRKQFEQIFWYAVFLAIDESKSLFGFDASALKRQLLKDLQFVIEEYASAAASSASSAWKAKYSEVLQDAIRRGLSAQIATANIKAASLSMAGRMRAIVHDDVMNAFRATLAEIGVGAGFSRERYEAMPGADRFCIPYDGKIYMAGDGPMPPIHRNCRCFRFPVSEK